MLKRSHRRTIVDLLIEALLIVFSVLVALAANRWRDQREARQRLAAAEQHIRVELEENKAILQNIIPYHEAEAQRIGAFLARPDLADQVRGRSMRDLEDQLMPHGFWNPTVSPQDLSDAAWQSALSDHSASLMPPQTVNRLMAYYAVQDSGVQHTLQLMGQQFLAPSMFDPRATILMLRTTQGWFSEIAAEEKELLYYADKNLNALSPHGRH